MTSPPYPEQVEQRLERATKGQGPMPTNKMLQSIQVGMTPSQEINWGATESAVEAAINEGRGVGGAAPTPEQVESGRQASACRAVMEAVVWLGREAPPQKGQFSCAASYVFTYGGLLEHMGKVAAGEQKVFGGLNGVKDALVRMGQAGIVTAAPDGGGRVLVAHSGVKRP